MIHLRRVLTNTLVWLAVMSVPIQGLAFADCCCAIGGRGEAKTYSPGSKTVCHVSCACCKNAQSSRGPTGSKHPCCQRSPMAAPHDHCSACDSCSCSAAGSTPLPASPTNARDSQLAGQVLQTPFAGVITLSPIRGETEDQPAVCPYASERCAVLCSFQF
jgi:hypothetical protein